MSLRKIIKQRRVSMEMSMSALAREIGISGNWMAKIENDGNIPSDEILENLASALDDDDGEIFKAACQERGFVTIESDNEAVIDLLINLRERAPYLSPKVLKKVSEVLG